MKKINLILLFAYCAGVCRGFVIASSPSTVEDKKYEAYTPKEDKKNKTRLVTLEELQNIVPLLENGSVKVSNIDERSFIFIDTKYKVPFLNHLHNIQSDKDKEYLVENFNYKAFVSNLSPIKSVVFDENNEAEENDDYRAYIPTPRQVDPSILSSQMKQMKWKIESENKKLINTKKYDSLSPIIPGEEESGRKNIKIQNYDGLTKMDENKVINMIPTNNKINNIINNKINMSNRITGKTDENFKYMDLDTHNDVMNVPIILNAIKQKDNNKNVHDMQTNNILKQNTINPINSYFMPSYTLKGKNHASFNVDKKPEEIQYKSLEEKFQRLNNDNEVHAYKSNEYDDSERNFYTKEYIDGSSRTTCDPSVHSHKSDTPMSSGGTCHCASMNEGAKKNGNNKVDVKLQNHGEITRTAMDFDFDDAVNKLL